MASQHIADVAEIVGLNSTRKAILFAIANAANLDGEWKLDRARLQAMAGVKERAMRDNLRWLHRHCYLKDLGGDYLAITP